MEELAAEYGFNFDILTADIDERAIGDRSASPEQLVLNLGRAKAEAILKKLPAPPQPLHFLITCDQVVVHEGKVLEKPETAEEVLHLCMHDGVSPQPLIHATSTRTSQA